MSNASLFLALPFAYLFCESEGLPFLGTRRGLAARAKETIVTLILLSQGRGEGVVMATSILLLEGRVEC